MSRALLSGFFCLIGVILLMIAFRAAAWRYQPYYKLETNLAERQTSMAALLANAKQTKLATDLARKATETDPNWAQAHYMLATLFAIDNRKKEAMLEYSRAIRCKPDWIEPRINLGILLGQSGLLEEAAEQFRAAGDDPNARRNLELTEQAIKDRKRRRRP
ncbi:hypothetical protein K2Y11_07095 [bacterium]|nr:hypothetical protein [bacterium]